MISRPIFRGAATALITPFNENGIDYPALGELIDWQIGQDIDALVIAGTTGESSTLSEEEYRALLRFSAEHIAGRVPAIAGTGSNNTLRAIERSRYACSLGYDALLVVTPYYNKTTQRGLVQSYTAIANAADKPLIVYNVPSRTGVNIAPATYAALAEHPNIAAVKEANGDMAAIAETAALVEERLDIYSGNDDCIVPVLAMGGSGVISVLSNLLPRPVHELCQCFFDGDIAGAAAMQRRYMPLIKALFSETNPIPVKAAMAALGICENNLRLPLVPMEEENRKRLLACMREQGLPV